MKVPRYWGTFFTKEIMKRFELNKLSSQFYADYPQNEYPELLHKDFRPYMVFVIEINGIKFAIPFRTNIRHNYGYNFRSTTRHTNSSTGLDFTKAVVISKDEYIGEKTDIDDKEHLELSNRFFFITNKFKNYLNGYIYFTQHPNTLLAAKYKYSSLQYFHKELGIE